MSKLTLLILPLPFCHIKGQSDSLPKNKMKWDRAFGSLSPLDTDTFQLPEGDLIIFQKFDSSIHRINQAGKMKWKKVTRGINNSFAGINEEDMLRLDRFVLRPYDLRIWVYDYNLVVLLSSRSGKILILKKRGLDSIASASFRN